jgi:hypothetical protein
MAQAHGRVVASDGLTASASYVVDGGGACVPPASDIGFRQVIES